jgi:hypothetical protein
MISLISKKAWAREESLIVKNRIDLSLGSTPFVVDSRQSDISMHPNSTLLNRMTAIRYFSNCK